MCGIFCAINENKDVACELHSRLDKLLNNRGPDVKDKLIIDNVLLAGNVLWQQGAAPQKQPITNEDWSLLFNGDLYNLGTDKLATQSDSNWLMEKLTKCEEDKELLSLLQQLQGPYCLILYNKLNKTLYFCRDALGRNSLIIERSTECIQLLSTSCHLGQTNSLELPPLGLYKLQLDALDKCILYPWQSLNKDTRQQLEMLDKAMRWQTHVACPIAPQWLHKKPDPTDNYDLYELVDETSFELEQIYQRLLNNRQVQKTVEIFDKLLQQSVAERVLNTAPVCRNCLNCGKCEHAKICLLFSGGIDCTILALLANKYVPETEEIELINVAFERITTGANDVDATWNVPDRQTAKQSYEELQRLCPERKWQLLEVNVARKELQHKLATHIHQLIYPLQTVLDECLGCAFWFAASAEKSTARVALLGSGADELFGGYTRHRNAYRRAGNNLEALHNELEMDWQRIPARNLARDDRVIADCGKTARAPFIEEHVSQFIRSLTPQQRCCYKLPEGVGDKLLLRLYGYSLGLRDAVLLKKRAIQFGSRIADKKQQANQISEYLRFESLQLS